MRSRILTSMTPEIQIILDFHELTKHHLGRYAPGPDSLDWATQPDPFRRYLGAPVIPLNRDAPGERPLYEPVFVEGRLPVQWLNRASVSQLFYDALALSAWKQVGNVRWSLRVNPSSGNLHPTEGYLICGPVEGISDRPMVCHYAPKEHALECRAQFSRETWNALTANFPESTVFIGLSSIYWREAWKYGARAFRYCQHDIGHAIATVTLAAAALGWKAVLLDDLSTDSLSSLMGVFDAEGAEPEQPECLLAVYPQSESCPVPILPEELTASFRTLSWLGTPNRLSPASVEWPAINRVAEASRKPATRRVYGPGGALGTPLQIGSAPISFRKVVHQRRSCLGLDGRTGITRDALYQILRKCVPGRIRFPFNAPPWPPLIHFAIFIHRVEDVDPGLYFMTRDPAALPQLKSVMKKEFEWEKPPGCPEDVELYRLLTGDARALSRQISCHQDIASDGCFSLAMMAQFEEPIQRYGAWIYPRLFWEAGLIGQVLYLEAEASGIRGTGIGCYFDDPMHDVLGLSDRRFQDLYHFTMGGPVEDSRLTTLPPYPEI
jgi:SagB-type dehydrogenase family enzyme